MFEETKKQSFVDGLHPCRKNNEAHHRRLSQDQIFVNDNQNFIYSAISKINNLWVATVDNIPMDGVTHPELDYAVMCNYDPFDYNGISYRVDVIQRNGYHYLRFVPDLEKTLAQRENKLSRLIHGLGLKSEKTNNSLNGWKTFLTGLLNENLNNDRNEAITAEINKIESEILEKQKRATQSIEESKIFYKNPYIVSTLAEQYLLSVHPKLGLLLLV